MSTKRILKILESIFDPKVPGHKFKVLAVIVLLLGTVLLAWWEHETGEPTLSPILYLLVGAVLIVIAVFFMYLQADLHHKHPKNHAES